MVAYEHSCDFIFVQNYLFSYSLLCQLCSRFVFIFNREVWELYKCKSVWAHVTDSMCNLDNEG